MANPTMMTIFNKSRAPFTVRDTWSKKGESKIITISPNRSAEMPVDRAKKIMKDYPLHWSADEKSIKKMEAIEKRANDLNKKEKQIAEREKLVDEKEKQIAELEKQLEAAKVATKPKEGEE